MSATLSLVDRSGLINRIADRTLTMLIDKRIIDDVPRLDPVFYAWPRDRRLVIVLDPVRVKNPDAIMNERFRRHLSLTLDGLPVAAMNDPALVLQIGFERIAEQALIARPLDLAEQPSPLHVPLGITRRGEWWLSIVEMDSVLIGGLRRLGKTNLLHTWIQALEHGDACEVWIWDGKPNNNEFRNYAGHQNVELIGYGDLLKYLTDLRDMLSDRSRTLAQAGAANITEFNRMVEADRALIPIVLIIDEAAEINTRPDAAEILESLASLISIGGAYGIHPAIATQQPTAATIGRLVKANLKTRIALPVTSNVESRLILDRVGAEKLDKSAPGRFLIVWGDLIECQAFLANPIELCTSRAPIEQTAASDRPDTFTPQAPPTHEELQLALRCKNENGARFTEEWLRALGYSQDGARLLRRQWRQREWIVPDASVLGKPLSLSGYIYALLSDLPTEGTEGHG